MPHMESNHAPHGTQPCKCGLLYRAKHYYVLSLTHIGDSRNHLYYTTNTLEPIHATHGIQPRPTWNPTMPHMEPNHAPHGTQPCKCGLLYRAKHYYVLSLTHIGDSRNHLYYTTNTLEPIHATHGIQPRPTWNSTIPYAKSNNINDTLPSVNTAKLEGST